MGCFFARNVFFLFTDVYRNMRPTNSYKLSQEDRKQSIDASLKAHGSSIMNIAIVN